MIEKDREGICVMQLKDEEGAIVSPTFAFIGKKVRLPRMPGIMVVFRLTEPCPPSGTRPS